MAGHNPKKLNSTMGGETMGDDYNKELCDFKHEQLDKSLADIKSKVDIVANRINWFYVIAITTLFGVIANLVK